MAATSPAAGNGHVLAALEVEQNDGPWVRPDKYQKVNGVLRYSRGDAANGLSLTGMGYPRDLEFHGPGAAARDRQGTDRTVRRTCSPTSRSSLTIPFAATSFIRPIIDS